MTPDPEPDVSVPQARPGSWWLAVGLIALLTTVILMVVMFWGDPDAVAPDPVDANGPADAMPRIPVGGDAP